MEFDGKVAFITGAAQGFGYAFAESLGADGASVVIADVNSQAGEVAAAKLRDQGIKALAVACDVSDSESVNAAIAASIAEFGGVDILINNAGLHLTKYSQPFHVLGVKDTKALFDVNVLGVVYCTLACQETMTARGGGSIINISSMASNMPGSPYGVSKLAVRGLTIAFSREFANANIRVNAISPGLMATEAAIADLPNDMVQNMINVQQAVHRIGSIDDIVNMMRFLISEKASFVTGETYRVSGGAMQGI
ncbi:MAG: SDR family oxidoreductase [Actinomycetota bacterium]|nr:SDR family oxidoreductase [Actinomycetota bacterium]